MDLTRKIATLAVLVPGIAWSAPPCDAFNEAIESSLKTIAMTVAEGLGDDSAPRETLRQARISNELALIRLQLDLAARNQCPARREPIRDLKYLTDAVDCKSALLDGLKSPPACDRATWDGK